MAIRVIVFLTLTGLCVADSKGNLALNAKAVQSSTYNPDGIAEHAVDGKRDSNYRKGSCSHTKTEFNPWWRVDLGNVYSVHNVTITNRGDCCKDRLRGAQIRIGNSLDNNGNNNELAATLLTAPDGTQTFSFEPVNGRYVNIYLPGNDEVLTLCEVEVFTENDIPTYICVPRNLALGATAVQSSTYETAAAQKAVDGNRNSNYFSGSCSHTNGDRDPWWRVDLLEVYEITRVSITNRGDGNAPRINGAQIRIGNSLENNGNNNELAATVVSIPLGETQTFKFQPIKGRYVNIFVPERTEYLTLCEVEVFAVPDAPTDLRAINVTDSKALLLWRPALATVDHYIIVYSSDTAPGSGITIKVSGNAVEQQLQALQSSTQYSVSVQSRRGDLSSSRATAVFSTTGAGKIVDGPRDLKASQVTPRTAVLSWKPPVSAITGYKLSYYTDSQDIKEVIVEPTLTELKLSRLKPSSTYTARLRAMSGGLESVTISTEFSTGNLRFPFPTDCSQEQQNGVLESGIVELFPQGREGKPVMVYCDMETDGGGWMVFQRRKDGKTNFFRSWREYSSGFGALDGEFWLGNELLHNFTKMSPMTLRIDLRAGDESVFARYSSFSVENAKKHYTIRVSGYSGTAGDSMSYHNGRPFSTRDRDPQPFITRCAMSYRGGWWYKNCHEANLNGLYNTNKNHQGVIWTEWKGKDFSIPFTEMKFRPASFRP